MKIKRKVIFILFLFTLFMMNTVTVMASVLGPVRVNGNRNFKWPVPGIYNFTSCFFDKCAEHPKGDHYAIDIGAAEGTSIVAVYDGVVVQHRDNGHDDKGFGNTVLVRHDNIPMADGSTKTLYTRYSHMHSISVTDGQRVVGGITEIGTVGGTASGGTPYARALHLDFQVLDLPAPDYWNDRWSYSIDPFSNNLFENVVNNLQKYDTCQYASSYFTEIKKIYSSNPNAGSLTPSTIPHNPIGYLDVAEGGDGKIHVYGWALDYDAPTTPLEVHIYIGGAYGDSAIEGRAIKADKYRDDVPKALNNSSVGNYHGFDEWLDVGYTGTYPVYAYAINVGSKDNSNCNTRLTNAPKTITIRSAVQTCSTPNISFADIINGKQVNISANSGETVNYTIKKNGISIGSGTAYEAYSMTLSEEGNYEVSAYASKSGNNNSGNQSKSTTVSKVETPVITQSVTGSGIVLSMQSATSATSIYYTTSGNTPTINSNKFSGAVIVDSEKIIKAIAVKAGYLNSDIGETQIKLSVPPSPIGFKLDSADKIAVGENVSVSWEPETAAASYTITLYKNNQEISHTTTSGTSATLNLPASGKYQIKIFSTNFVGNSVMSDTVLDVEAMDPLKVRFEDWNGTLIKEQEVPYGKEAILPEDPSRRGYTFLSWVNGEKITNVTENLTVTASYKINTYLVRFYDASMNQVGASQKVDYGASAVSPEKQLTDIPTGYAFAGWKVIECASDSQCNYLEVDSDMKLQAVYYWENEDLPIVNEITSATWDSTTGNYTVKVKLTNYPTDITTALLRVSLFTSQGKMVKSTKTEFDVLADQSNEKEITLKYNGTATVAKACVLGINGNDLTGSALSKESSKNITCLSGTVWSDWSEWSTTEPTVADGQQVDQIVQYRYSDKATTSSSSSSMAGWTLYNTISSWSDYGSWSDWSENHRDASDSVQVEGRVIYRYYCFYCPVCGGREPYQGKSDCGRYTLTQANAQEYWSTVPFSACNPQSYSYTSAKKWTTSLGDGQRWNLSTADIDHTDIGYQGDAGCPIIRYQTRYRTRNLIYTYCYYKWSDWSEWSETEVTANDNRKVETRTLYRTRDEVPVYDDLTGIEEMGTPYTISGELKFKDPDLCGKLATVMVYKGKNIDPNEDQIQYISQTTIGEGNSYSFTIIAKNDPSILSGDYTVCLGIEGATGLINVDMIEAPRATYTVVYVDDDGTEISVQTVAEGDNAVVPDSPSKKGYLFTGWSSNAINVNENMTIVAMYAPVQYVVAFVDSKNNTMTCDTYNYGDEIEIPVDPFCEGCIFRGWDKIMDGTTNVTENMIINAVYDVKKYTVVFVDEKGESISNQQIAHGGCAVPPTPLDVSGMEFKGWSTEKNWWNVTEDVIVEPILTYAETTETPSYYILEMEDSIAVFLETSTENADIYYSYGNSIPTMDDGKYEEEPIIIPYYQMDYELTETATEYIMNVSAELNAFAVCEGKNDSEVQTITYEAEKSYHINQNLTITLDVNGGDPLDSSTMTVVETELIGTMPVPTRPGYEFAGWFTAANGGEQITEESTITSDCTLYAHWNEPHKHVNTEIRDAKEASTEEEGYTGDTYCIDCGELVSKGTIIPKLTIDENAPVITATGGKVVTGKEITVFVDISKNIGIAGFSYDVNYDETVLTLKSVSAGNLISGNGQISTNGKVVNWYTSDNVTGDGTLLNLVFTAASDAQAGTYPVSIALHDGKKNLVDENGTFIEANYISGQVEITTGMLGDLNGDDDITIADVVLLNRHVLGKTTISSDRLIFADINGDEDITIGDVVLLNRHVLGKINLTEPAAEVQLFGMSLGLNETQIVVDSITAKPGEQISVPVRVSGNTGIAGLAFSVTIPEGYTLNSITAGPLLTSGTFSTNAQNCTWYTTDNMTEDGILMNINLTVEDSAKTGEIAVNVKDNKTNNLSDENGTTVPAQFVVGTITIDNQTECDINGHKGGQATCVQKAICDVCGQEYGEISADNHIGETEVQGEKEANCTEKGYTGDIYCKSCGEKLQTGTEIDMIEHSWDAGNVTIQPNCTTQGEKTYTCSKCNKTKTEIISATGHVETEIREAKEATCTEKGYTGDTYCKACGEKLQTGTETDMIEHSWDAGNVTIQPDCTTKGEKTYTCSKCNKTKTEIIPATGHVETEIREAKEATCTEKGYTGDTYCKACGEKLQTGTETDMIEHSWDAGTVITAPTCTEEGEAIFQCVKCLKTKRGSVPVSGHVGATETRNSKAATCTAAGYTGDVYCKSCGELLKLGQSIPALGHKWNGGVVTQAATATANGIKTYTCNTCGTTTTETIKATGVAVPAQPAAPAVQKAKPGTVTKDKTSGGVYKVAKDGLTVEYTKPISTKKTSVKIPDTVKVNGIKCKVTSIAANAFKNNKTLTKIVISNNVASIGKNAFSGCKKLTTVSGGKGILVIGAGAFNGCSKLKTFSLGGKVTSIGEKAFYKCTSLSKISIPARVKTIGKQAFYGCSKLKSLTIKTTLLTAKNVGSNAFKGIYSKVTVAVPKKMAKSYTKLLTARGVNKKAKYKKF